MNISKKQGWIIVYTVLAFVVIIVAWGSWVKFGSKPLDDQAIYIGRKITGCLFPLCASEPVDYFYYATDLTLDEIMYSYFNNGEVVSGPNSSSYTDSGAHWTMTFQNKDNGKKFYLGFYQDGKYFANNKKLEIGDKKYIVEIKDRDNYNMAKDSL